MPMSSGKKFLACKTGFALFHLAAFLVGIMLGSTQLNKEDG